MLMRTDPFRQPDRLVQEATGTAQGTWSRPTRMPMDAYRDGDTFTVCFDLPGVDPAIGDAAGERTSVESATGDRI